MPQFVEQSSLHFVLDKSSMELYSFKTHHQDALFMVKIYYTVSLGDFFKISPKVTLLATFGPNEM